VNHGDGIGGSRAARVVERPSAAATEVDAKLFEDRGGPKISRHEFSDRLRLYVLIHGCGSVPIQSSGTIGGTV
jgi:hypothetical protein